MTKKNNPNVFISSYQPYTVFLTRLLEKELGWQPKVWVCTEHNQKLVTRNYPKVLQYDFHSMVKGISPSYLSENEFAYPSPEELDIYSQYEHNFLYMLERNDSNYSAFEYKERLSFYYRIIGLWKVLLQRFEIKVVLFEEEPHQAVEYALYAVAKVTGVTTIMSVRTVSELGIIPMFDFTEGMPTLNKRYQDVLQMYQKERYIDIDKEVEDYFSRLNADYQTVLKEHLWNQVDEFNSLAGKGKRTWKSVAYAAGKLNKGVAAISRFIMNPPMPSDQFKPRMKLQESTFSYRNYYINKTRTIRKKRSLKRFYESVALSDLTSLSKEKKYLYIALQYQPEKSTCPLAGRFVDQKYLIQWLSCRLDDSWQLLVKEHPSQFITEYSRFGDCLRSENYYKDILKIPRVNLLSLSFDSFAIMEKVHAVGSAGGTVCWESLARGTPVLNFAACWFKSCHGVFNIRSNDDLQMAINDILSGFRPDPYLVKAFAQVIHSLNFKAAVGGESNLNQKNLDAESNAQAHFEAIKTLLK